LAFGDIVLNFLLVFHVSNLDIFLEFSINFIHFKHLVSIRRFFVTIVVLLQKN